MIQYFLFMLIGFFRKSTISKLFGSETPDVGDAIEKKKSDPVIPENASDITNDSSVAGITVKEALDTLNLSLEGIKSGRLVLSAAKVLVLNDFPVDLPIDLPGDGKYIEIINADSFLNFDSVPYATNTQIELIYDTATKPIMSSPALLGATTSTHRNFTKLTATGVADAQILENKKVMVKATGGNPTVGDSVVIIYFTYKITNI